MIKAWPDAAWEEFEYWMKQDKKTLRGILQLLKDIEQNGYDGIDRPERLSGDLAAYWSRRIDDANRIVYRIGDNVIKVVQCGSHYRDKQGGNILVTENQGSTGRTFRGECPFTLYGGIGG